MTRTRGRGFVLLLVLLIAGCATAGRMVVLTVERPGPMADWDVERLAVVDFVVPYQTGAWHRETTGLAAALLATPHGPRILPPETVRAEIVARRLTPSGLLHPPALRRLGEAIGADAVCYGDLELPRVRETREREVRRTWLGTYPEEVVVTDAQGNTRTETRMMPRWRERTVILLRYYAVVVAAARVVRVADGRLLWEGRARGEAHATIERPADTRTPATDPSAGLRRRAAAEALRRLFEPLRPRTTRTRRRLVQADTPGIYAQHLLRGNAAALQGRWEEAGAHWRRAANLAPARPEAWSNLGVLREREGDREGALREYGKAAARGRGPWDAYRRALQSGPETDGG